MSECAECGAKQERVAGVEIQGIYDGVCYWVCLDCGNRWHRFEEGDPRHERVESYWAS